MRIVKKKFIVHAILKCIICNWETQEYKDAEELAMKHVKETDHRVEGELGYGYSVGYNANE